MSGYERVVGDSKINSTPQEFIKSLTDVAYKRGFCCGLFAGMFAILAIIVVLVK